MRPVIPRVLSGLGLIVLAGLVSGWAFTARTQAVLSEFLADNATGLRDEDGDTSDWIEISNPRTEALDLAGWRLTDRENTPGPWRFPEGVVLQGGGVWWSSPQAKTAPSPGDRCTPISTSTPKANTSPYFRPRVIPLPRPLRPAIQRGVRMSPSVPGFGK